MRAAPTILVLLVLLPLALPAAPALPDDGRGSCAATLEQRAGSVRAFPYTEEPGMAAWRTWSVAPGDVAVGAPPSATSAQALAERVELHRLEAERTDAQLRTARAWDVVPASLPWEAKLLELVAATSATDPMQNPPRVSREIAILETVLFDTLVVAWDAKWCHQRAPPSAADPTLRPALPVRALPSYPSEHAALAGAAATVLGAFWPARAADLEDLAREAAESRVVAGVNYRSDVDEGLRLGRAVAERALALRADDGSAASWDGAGRLTGPCKWAPTLPSFQGPLEPMWGHVRPFVVDDVAAIRPPPPPVCGSAAYEENVTRIHSATVALTPEQAQLARRWAGGGGTVTPPGMGLWMAMNESVAHGLSTPRHARVMAHVGAALADAGIAAWDAKYAYWADRPLPAIASFDAAWRPLLATPPFPGYVSGHSAFSAATAGVLVDFFPARAPFLHAQAKEASDSRFYGGIHVPYDSEAGLELGARVAEAALARARGDGA